MNEVYKNMDFMQAAYWNSLLISVKTSFKFHHTENCPSHRKQRTPTLALYANGRLQFDLFVLLTRTSTQLSDQIATHHNTTSNYGV